MHDVLVLRCLIPVRFACCHCVPACMGKNLLNSNCRILFDPSQSTQIRTNAKDFTSR